MSNTGTSNINVSFSTSCIICLNDINDCNKHKLDCGHLFHTECIVNWFRTNNSNGRCPLCNDNTHSNVNFLPWYTREYVHERCKVLRNYNRRKIAPTNLNKMFDKLKILEEKQKVMDIEFKEFRKENKDIYKKTIYLRNKCWKNTQLIRSQKCKIVSEFPMLQP